MLESSAMGEDKVVEACIIMVKLKQRSGTKTTSLELFDDEILLIYLLFL